MIYSIKAWTQPTVHLALLTDEEEIAQELVQETKQEIVSVLEGMYTPIFSEYQVDGSTHIDKELEAWYDNHDIVVSLSVFASFYVHRRKVFPKPTILGLSTRSSVTPYSRTHNLTYIQSPYDVDADIDRFLKLHSFDTLTVFVDPTYAPIVTSMIQAPLSGKNIVLRFIELEGDPLKVVSQLASSLEAVYLLPLSYSGKGKESKLIDALNDQGVPTFAFLGRPVVAKGALAGLANAEYMETYARRIALNVMNILEGVDAADLPVRLETIQPDYTINIRTAKRIGLYPSFDEMAEASLIGLLEPDEDARNINLQGTVLEALTNNLNISIAEKSIGIKEQEVVSARSRLLPSLTAGASTTWVDDQTAASQQNVLTGELSLAGSLSLEQVIFSEPAFAGLAIQKLLVNSENEALRQARLDVILSTSEAYILYLLARANVHVQESNVEVTKTNLDLAKNRASIGSSSAADTYRFEAQLAQNSAALNDALRDMEQARFRLNLELNRPKNDPIDADEVSAETPLVFLHDGRVAQFVNNPFEAQKFCEFLWEYARKNLPSLRQMDLGISIQKRSLKAAQRSLYLPTVTMNGSTNKILGRYLEQVPEMVLQMNGLDPNHVFWSVGLNAGIPIFQGFSRRGDIEKAKVGLWQLEEQKDLLSQSEETRIRALFESLTNNYGDVLLTEKSLEAAKNYLDIVVDLYREGATNIATLLDAQNNALASELAHINANYQLLLSAFELENAIGISYLAASEVEREGFIQEFQTFMLSQ